MSKVLKIGTWNLERSGAHHRSRIPGQIACLAAQDCDLWVLTETHVDLQPEGQAQPICSRRDPLLQASGEHLVALWSRFPMERVETASPVFTAAARLHPPGMPRPLLVYGTVITYAHDTAPREGEGPARAWMRHRAAVAAQTQEWRELRERFPDHDLCVAGDFNMNLDGTRWYGVNDARDALLRGLADVGMRCWTTENFRATRPEIGRASVDHIAYSETPGLRVAVRAWPGSLGSVKLSDHNGVAIEVRMPP